MTLRNNLLSLMAATALLPWDNADAGTAYFANTIGTSNGTSPGNIGIMDTATDKATGIISGLNLPYELVITPDGSKLYVPNTEVYTVSVISTATNKVIDTISLPPVAYSPIDIAIHPSGTRVYVTGLNDQDLGVVAVIDTATDKVIDTLSFDEFAQDVVISPDGKQGYVGLSEDSTIAVFDTSTDKVINQIGVGQAPVGFATAHTPSGNRLYVADSPAIDVINTDTDKVIASIPVIEGDDPVAAAVNPSGTRAYIADQSNGYLYVVDTGTNKLITIVGLSENGRSDFTEGVAVSADGTQVYVTKDDGENNTPGIFVVDAATNKQIDFIPTSPSGTQLVGSNPRGIVVAPSNR